MSAESFLSNWFTKFTKTETETHDHFCRWKRIKRTYDLQVEKSKQVEDVPEETVVVFLFLVTTDLHVNRYYYMFVHVFTNVLIINKLNNF